MFVPRCFPIPKNDYPACRDGVSFLAPETTEHVAPVCSAKMTGSYPGGNAGAVAELSDRGHHVPLLLGGARRCADLRPSSADAMRANLVWLRGGRADG